MPKNIPTAEQLDPITLEHVQQYLEEDYDEETKNTIRRLLRENPTALIDAFYTHLSFGTSGLRGIMGVGTNRLNPYTVRATTQGIAQYLNQQFSDTTISVFIGYDSRHFSRQFAEETAKVFAGNGIKVYLCKNIRPTPYVSFGCRYKKCQAAVMITASHNPPYYNGYKVYWGDGGQVLAPHDKGIIAQIKKITRLSMIQQVASLEHPLIEGVEEEIDHAYLQALANLQLHPEDNHTHGKDLNIIYTSLHGVGITLVPQALKSWGFSNLQYVESQITPDGDFPGTPSLNPEEPEALSAGLDLLKKKQADLLIATDPDADRLGVALWHAGNIERLTGNQVACICLEHICETMTQLQTLPERAAFVKTIVTTELFKEIVERFHRTCFNVLPGFKYIAELIHQWEVNPKGYHFVFGAEESCGYLEGTYTRDKDAVLSSALICEIALQAKRKGKTLVDLLHSLYHKYGYHFETVFSLPFEDTKKGKEKIVTGIDQIRQSPFLSFDHLAVESFDDLSVSQKFFFKTKKTVPIDLPKANILIFWLADGSKIVVRPSGSESKVKIYCEIKLKKFENINQAHEYCTSLSKQIYHCIKQKFIP